MLKTYKYKVKPYRKIGKKTKYGAFSSVITRKAVRRYGQYDVEVIETKGDPCTEVTVKMTSIAGNGDLKIYREQGGMYEPTNILDDGHGVEVCYGKKSLSDSWMDLSNGNVIVLKSGESIYLKMEVTGPDFSYDKYASSTAYFYLLPAYYDGKYGHFGIEFYKNSGWSGENQEY